MRTEKFDAYGQALPLPERGEGEATGRARAPLARAGLWIFWLLVAVIVSARILFYPVSPTFDSGKASEPKHGVTR